MNEPLRIGLPPQSPQPLASRRRWPLIAGIATGILLLAGASTAAILIRDSRTASGPTIDVRGSITLPAGRSLSAGGSCAGTGGYNDLAPGAQVTVTNETGAVLGVGRIIDGAGGGTSRCVLTFEVDGVPRGARFYGVEVTHRGKIHKTEAELIQGPLELSIG